MIALLAPAAIRAELIFDNTTTAFAGSRAFTSEQIGDEVTAGGTGRSVTQLEVGPSSQGEPTTVSTLQAFL